MITQALAYAERGWAVFPCKTGMKEPATKHGFKDATIDPERIRKWWTRNPSYNIGLATGEAAGLVVLDVDPRHDGTATLAALITEHGDLPTTIESATGGGGRHLLFAHPGGHVPSRANSLGAGVDVKADGGYIIAPPSVHPDGGLYRWAVSPDDAITAPLPAWLVSMLSKAKVSRADYGCISCVSESLCLCVSVSLCQWVEQSIMATLPTAPGQRNDKAIFNFARRLRAHPDLANATATDLRPHVAAWHAAAEPYISGEHNADATRADFMHAWDRVKYPAGTGPVAAALANADAAEPPACAQGYEQPTRRLVGLCRELQRQAGDKPFFLACRVLDELLGIDRDRASRLLGLLCADGVLQLVNKGHIGRASEYLYVGD